MNRNDTGNIFTLPWSDSKTAILLTTLLIGVNYLWTANAYLSWTDRMSGLAEVSSTYMATEVYGPIAQMIGLFLFAILIRYDAGSILFGKLTLVVIALDGCSILPIIFAGEFETVLLWGLIMNLFHGFIAGHYIAILVSLIPGNRRGLCFGIGYAFGSLCSYLLSLLAGGSSGAVALSRFILLLLILSGGVLILCVNRFCHQKNDEKSAFPPSEPLSPSFLKEKPALLPPFLLAGAVVTLLSLTTQLLFYSPAQTYLADPRLLHFTHMFYAFGLIAAALTNDRSRKAGLILALLSLCFPLLSLSLYQMNGVHTALAILGNVATGFYAVYRIVVFTDLCERDKRLLFLAPAGLFCGRLGETIGAAAGYAIDTRHILLTIVTAVLFTVSIVSSFLLYIRLYGTRPVISAENYAKQFYAQYDISLREQQVFLLLVEGKTNPEIAEALFISENTVKFHVKNLLRKTGCKKRTDMIQMYEKSTHF